VNDLVSVRGRVPGLTRVKVCGLTRIEDVQGAVAAGVDAIGFVFVAGTPRCVTVEWAARLRREVPPFVTAVGLFVDAPVETVLSTVESVRLDAVQLHGSEPPELAGACLQRTRVIKAFRVKGSDTIAGLERYREVADAFLLDAFVPGAHGGTGAKFDWDLAVAALSSGRPVILAGGLNPDNVGEAVSRVRPFAVDVSSGVESGPGLKDARRIREFVAAANGRIPSVRGREG
jgi:phosphoribosylanthranilate isomerase